MAAELIQVFAENIHHPRWDDAETRFQSQLPVHLVQSLLRLKHPLQRRRSMVARLMLAEVLERHYASPETIHHWNILPTDKPSLPDYHFNFSHSGDWVLLAINKHVEIGVDVERKRSIKPEKFQKHYAPGELEQVLNAADRSLAFIEWWTKKEALVKAVGTGLRMPLRDLIEAKPRTYAIDGKQYTAVPLPPPHPEYRAHLAVCGVNPMIQVNYTSVPA